jgi:hypothetical protein
MGKVMLSVGEAGYTGIRACTKWWSLAWAGFRAITEGCTKHKDMFPFSFYFFLGIRRINVEAF